MNDLDPAVAILLTLLVVLTLWAFYCVLIVSRGAWAGTGARRLAGRRFGKEFAAKIDALQTTSAPAQAKLDARPLRFLALLQRDGRLLDFLLEDVRRRDRRRAWSGRGEIHRQCQKAFAPARGLEPVLAEDEASVVDIPSGFDPSAIRLTGNVTGTLPFQGMLIHRGCASRTSSCHRFRRGRTRWFCSQPRLNCDNIHRPSLSLAKHSQSENSCPLRVSWLASTWERPIPRSPISTRARGMNPGCSIFRFHRLSQPGVVEERGRCCRRFCICRAERAARRQPESAVGGGTRLLRRRVCAQLRQPGADAAGRFRQVVAVLMPASIAGSRCCRGRRRRMAGAFRRSKPRRYYLKHLVRCLELSIAKDVADHRLENQDIILTVPASFDAVARELTVEAARAAGLDKVTLLEEPQAAFYAWIDVSQDRWREQVEVGDVVLVCDVGGGTTDLSLIAVSEEAGQLGADARGRRRSHPAGRRQHGSGPGPSRRRSVSPPGASSSMPGQMHMLWHSCRLAKETLFADRELAAAPVTVLGRGSRVIGGTLKGELARGRRWKKAGGRFLSRIVPPTPCRSASAPSASRKSVCPTRPIPPSASTWPSFSTATPRSSAEGHKRGKKKRPASRRPCCSTAAFSRRLRCADRMLEDLNDWIKSRRPRIARHRPGSGGRAAGPPTMAWSGAARAFAFAAAPARGLLHRRGNLAARRSRQRRRPIKALCVVPFGMEEGTEADVPGQEFGLIVGEPAEFRFLGSSTAATIPLAFWWRNGRGDDRRTRAHDHHPRSPGKEGRMVPVHLHSKSDGGRHARTVVPQPGRQGALEAGIQCPRARRRRIKSADR